MRPWHHGTAGHRDETALAPSPNASKPLSSSAAARTARRPFQPVSPNPEGNSQFPPPSGACLINLLLSNSAVSRNAGLLFLLRFQPFCSWRLQHVCVCPRVPMNLPRTQPGGDPAKPPAHAEEFGGASCPLQGYLLLVKAPPSHLLPLLKRACQLPPGPHPGPHIHLGSASCVFSSTVRLILNP